MDLKQQAEASVGVPAEATTTMKSAAPGSGGEAVLMMTARLIAGGAFLVAAFLKLKDPTGLMIAIEAFELVPMAFVPFLAYFVPWTEVVVGLLLVYGFWSRASGLLATGIYVMFTLAIMSVIFRGMSVDCGCFGGLGGNDPVSWKSVGRNLVFIAASLAIVWRGGGRASLDAVLGTDGGLPAFSKASKPASAAGAATAEQAS